MRKKLRNITWTINTLAALLVLLVIWQAVCMLGIVPGYMLPSPVQVVMAFAEDFPLLMSHLRVTLAEAFVGLICGVAFGFAMAVLMDRFEKLYRAVYPLVVLTQTVPTVAIAPLLVLWFGYEMLPKVILIVITTFSCNCRSTDRTQERRQGHHESAPVYGSRLFSDFPVCEAAGSNGTVFFQPQDLCGLFCCRSGDLRVAGRL